MRETLADNQFIVSPWGISTKKSPPSGLGPFSLGDITPLAYVDIYRRIRWPARPEIVAQFRNAAFICANLNANGVAQTPIKLYVKTSTGEPRPKCRVKGLSRKQQFWIRGEGHHAKASSALSGRLSTDDDVEEVPHHPLLELFAKPNPYHSCHDNFRLLSIFLDIVGTAYWWIGDRNRLGTPKEIWPIPSHLCYPWREMPETRELISYWLLTSGRFQVKIPVKDIVDFKWTDLWEPYSRGLSPLVAVWEHVGINERMLGHTQNMLDNQARPDALLTPDTMIGEYERQRLEQRINNKFRGGGFGAVLVTEESMKLQPLSWSPTDLGALEVHGATRDMICDAFGVPQALVTKETNLANLQAARSQHAELGILPRLCLRDETINRELIPLYDESGRLFVCSDNPIPEDEERLLKNRQIAVTAGWMTRNEARCQEGRKDESWGDIPTLPTSQQVLGEDGKPEPKPVAPGAGPGGPGGGKPNGGDSQSREGAAPSGKGKTDDSSKGMSPPSIAGRNSSPGQYAAGARNGVDDDFRKLLELSRAVQKGRISLSLARDLVAKDYGEERAILFEESLCGNCQKKANGLQKCVSRKIPIIAREHPEMDHDQVIAIAYSYCRKKRKKKAATDPLVCRALERLDSLPRFRADDPDDHVPVPFAVDLEPGYPPASLPQNQEEWQAIPVAQFDLRELCATQRAVKRDDVRECILKHDRGHEAPQHAHIVRYAGEPGKKSELYIDDGHHHLTALWLLGYTEGSGHYLDLTKGREVVVPPPVQVPEPKQVVRQIERDEFGLITRIVESSQPAGGAS